MGAMENGKYFQIWKEKANGDKYHYQTDIGLPCPSCPTKGDCSTIEVILELDGDAIKKECDFLGGKYKKITKLYDGKCIWVQIADPKAILRYNDFENAWVFGYD